MIYSLKNIKKKYNGRTVLDLPELDIRKNRIYALLGPNGAGKSTLLNILGFIDTPSEGIIEFNNRPVLYSRKNIFSLRKKVVLLDQHPIMFSTTVFKNVEFGLKVRNMDKKTRIKIVQKTLDLVGMLDFIDEDARTLSGGETQRVAIARALACNPQVILFDEPTSSVDTESRILIENIIKNIHENTDVSIIFSTHNQYQASKLSNDHIYIFSGFLSSSIHENIFSGNVIKKDTGTFCNTKSGILIPLKKQPSGIIRISIDPKFIQIWKRSSGRDAGHHFSGEITVITLEKNYIRLLVDIGTPLNVMINKKKFYSMNLMIGDNVFIKCPENSIKMLGSN